MCGEGADPSRPAIAARARLRLALLALAALPLAACASFPSPTPSAPPPATVVVASGLGRLATSTPAPPTATATVPATATELAPSPTSSPVGTRGEGAAAHLRSPTPELRPTRTAVPTATPAPIEVAGPAARAPARTPVGSSPPAMGVLQKPANTPAVRAPHYDFAHAQTLASGRDVPGIVLAPGQSNIHRFDVAGTEGQVTVTLSGPDADLYRTTLLSPDGAQAGPGAPVGTIGRTVSAPIRGQIGTWYVEVAVGPKGATPRGPYTIRADVRATSAA